MMPFGKPCTLLFLCLLSALAFPALAETTVAKVVLTQNTVTVQSNHQQPRAVKRGQVLKLDDILRTGSDSRGIFRFNDGTVLTLGSNSEIKIKTFAANDQHKHGLFEFVKGAFRIVTGSITQTSSPNFTVNTPIGSIGIRGTDFWGGNLNDDGSVDVLLIDSQHFLEVKNQYGVTLLKQANEGTTLKPNQAPLSARTWPDKKIQRALDSIATPDIF